MLLRIVLLSVLFCSVITAYTSYEGYQVVRAKINNTDQVQRVELLGIDVWSNDGLAMVGQLDMMVDGKQLHALGKMGVDFEVIIEDVERLVVEEREELLRNANKDTASFFEAYHNYADIVTYLQNLTSTYSKYATYVPTIGKSIEGRDIPAVYINVGNTAKKKILFTGGQHAREWIAPATVLYLLEQLLSKYETDAAVKRILDNVNFAIAPLLNPDGYAFSWTTTRLWRKNRRPNTGGSYGVDLNRNWDSHWCTNGASRTPSSDTYCGTAPASEPEVKSTSSWILENGFFHAYIDFHSYSQLVLRPYGWTNAVPPDETILKTAGDGISAAIRSIHQKSYTSEPAYTLYYTTGSADDWAYELGAAKLVYTIELRDTGSYGFNLPANQIIPTGQELWNAIQYLADYVITNL